MNGTYDSLRAQFEIDLERIRCERESSIKNIHLVARDDPTVAIFLQNWKSGNFRSWEEMLAGLCAELELAIEKARLLKEALKALEYSPPKTVIIDPNAFEKDVT